MKTNSKFIHLVNILALIIICLQFTGCNNTQERQSTSDISKSKKIEKNIQVDWITYSDVKSLVNNSEYIVSGEVIGVDTGIKLPYQYVLPEKVTKEQKEILEKSDDNYDIYTVSHFKVTEVIKGDVKVGDILYVYQLGGEDEKYVQMEKNATYLKKNGKNIIFAKEAVDEINYIGEIKIVTLNPMQGDIEIINGKISIHKENKLFQNSESDIDLIKLLKEKVK